MLRSSWTILSYWSLAAYMRLLRMLSEGVVRFVEVVFETQLLERFLEHALDLRFERVQRVHLLPYVHYLNYKPCHSIITRGYQPI